MNLNLPIRKLIYSIDFYLQFAIWFIIFLMGLRKQICKKQNPGDYVRTTLIKLTGFTKSGFHR